MPKARCLILACGNTLREDDGVGPWLAGWAEERFASEERVSIVTRQQWTPELAQDLSESESAIFIDCATNANPGEVLVVPVEPAKSGSTRLGTHHLDAAELLALSNELYGAMPRTSLLLTIGAGSLELREGFSEAMQGALPLACVKLEKAVLGMLATLAR